MSKFCFLIKIDSNTLHLLPKRFWISSTSTQTELNCLRKPNKPSLRLSKCRQRSSKTKSMGRLSTLLAKPNGSVTFPRRSRNKNMSKGSILLFLFVNMESIIIILRKSIPKWKQKLIAALWRLLTMRLSMKSSTF